MGTLIFSYIRRLRPFFFFLGGGVQNFEFHLFWGGGGVRKMKIFWDIKILWIFFGVITNLDYIQGSFLCILGSFLKVKVQNGGYFGVLLKFKYFLGYLKFLIFFG